MGLSAKDGAALLARVGQAAAAPRPADPETEQGGDLLASTGEELEYVDQRELAKALDAAGLDWAHVPNEGKRTGRSGASLAAAGLKKGFPDVVIFNGSTEGRFTVLELKRVGLRPRRPLKAGLPPWARPCFTAEQQRWLERFEALGWHALVAYGAADAIEQLRALGYPLGEVGR